ncbi:hypothetical protein Kim5_CH01195 [Rhizobium sp. Kim5]|nr:hypothetical protein Kim5_CH01195 [Rhizobium sp. Kim5]
MRELFKIGQALPPEAKKRLSKTFWQSSQNVLDLLYDQRLAASRRGIGTFTRRSSVAGKR